MKKKNKKPTTLAIRKLRLEKFLTKLLGDDVEIFLWNQRRDTVENVRVAEVSVFRYVHGGSDRLLRGYSWMQSDDEAAVIILLSERAIVEWDDKEERDEDLRRLQGVLTKR